MILRRMTELNEGYNVFVNAGLDGGKKKKKKKVYSTKNKATHVHKKQKLHTLKLYKIK